MGFNSASITATYATGSAYDGDGTSDNVGALVGRNTGTITDSYKNSDASVLGGENDDDNDTDGTRKTLSELMSLSFTDAGTSWTTDNWDMGDETELPTLANSNGSVAGNFCNQPVSSSQSRVLCPDDEPDDDGDGIADVADACPFEAVLEGGTDSNSDGCDDVNADEDGDGLTEDVGDIDRDGDGLIEIGAGGGVYLGHIHHNLAGTSHKTSATVTGNSTGCPSTGCNGYELRKDITLTNNWTPVGNSSDPFTGNFDGNGHTISNLTINSSAKYVGFFGYVSGSAITIIRNLIINGGSVTSTSTANYTFTGALAGYIGFAPVNNVSIIGVSVTGGTGDGVRIGGLVGTSSGTITNSYATGNADGGDGEEDRVGGLVGTSTGTITNSYATGSADGGAGNSDLVGGLVGTSTGTITNSYATGSADGGAGNSDLVGGLVGNNTGGTITNSYATGNASDGGGGERDRVGGLVGTSTGTITNSYATGSADGGDGDCDYVGGLVGTSSGTITNSYATGDASGGAGGTDHIGGLVGYNFYGAITNSYATGNASDGGGGNSDLVGGLVGGSSGTITNSYAMGNASDGGGGERDNVGGLVGHSSGTITNSYATGNASDGGGGERDRVGGLVGNNTGGTITNSYATGNASDGGGGERDSVGGLVGVSSDGEITNSYATGNASDGGGGNDFVGGLVGGGLSLLNK